MNIEDLLAPYRGFKPETDEETRTLMIARAHAVWRATPIKRGPDLESPDSWEMYEFVQGLTA